jgi:hypothetical protein
MFAEFTEFGKAGYPQKYPILIGSCLQRGMIWIHIWGSTRLQDMKNLFPGHYPPSTSFDEALPEALIIFDTNVLLNFYELGPDTRTRLFSALTQIRESCWLPYHVGLEFHRNRLGKIEQAFQAHREAVGKFRQEITALTSLLVKQDVLKHDARTEGFVKPLREAAEALANHADKAGSKLPQRSHDDPVNESLAAIFDGRVGPSPTQEEINKYNEEGRRRADHKHPPGVTDGNKAGERFLDRNVAYAGEWGDLYIWKQILQYVEEVNDKRFLIFVTDERKADWWAKDGKAILGPAPELCQELAICKPGWHLRMYSSARFFQHLSETRGVDLSTDDLQDILDAGLAVSRPSVKHSSQANLLARLLKSFSPEEPQHVSLYKKWAAEIAGQTEDCVFMSPVTSREHPLFFWHQNDAENPELLRLTLVSLMRPDDPRTPKEIIDTSLTMMSDVSMSGAIAFDTTALPEKMRSRFFGSVFLEAPWNSVGEGISIYATRIVDSQVEAHRIH